MSMNLNRQDDNHLRKVSANLQATVKFILNFTYTRTHYEPALGGGMEP